MNNDEMQKQIDESIENAAMNYGLIAMVIMLIVAFWPVVLAAVFLYCFLSWCLTMAESLWGFFGRRK